MIRLSEAFPQALGAWLFHLHPTVLLTMAVVTIVLLWRWRHTHTTKLLVGGGSIAAAGLLWVTMAWIVVTPGERLQSDIHSVLTAATRRDVTKIATYLAPNAALGGWDKAQIISALKYRLSHMRLTGNYLRHIHIRRRGRQAQTNITVLSTTHDYGPFITRWRLIWRDHPQPGSWRIIRLQLASIGDTAVSSQTPLGPPP